MGQCGTGAALFGQGAKKGYFLAHFQPNISPLSAQIRVLQPVTAANFSAKDRSSGPNGHKTAKQSFSELV